jgi:putative DNA primase/helicase
MENNKAKKKIAFAMKTLDNPLKFLQLAKSLPEIAVTADELDRELYKFNVQNGVIDLKTGELLPHNPSFKMTKISPASYNKDAEAPLFIKSLLYWMDGDQEMVDFMARLVGMGLTGDTGEQKLVKLLGNGKMENRF